MYAWENWTTLCVFTGHLVAALRGQTEFKTRDHSMILRKGEGDIQSRHLQYAQTALEEAMATAPTLNYHWLRRGTNMGTWLTGLDFSAIMTGT